MITVGLSVITLASYDKRCLKEILRKKKQHKNSKEKHFDSYLAVRKSRDAFTYFRGITG